MREDVALEEDVELDLDDLWQVSASLSLSLSLSLRDEGRRVLLH